MEADLARVTAERDALRRDALEMAMAIEALRSSGAPWAPGTVGDDHVKRGAEVAKRIFFTWGGE